MEHDHAGVRWRAYCTLRHAGVAVALRASLHVGGSVLYVACAVCHVAMINALMMMMMILPLSLQVGGSRVPCVLMLPAMWP
jgi:hypothetical protein